MSVKFLIFILSILFEERLRGNASRYWSRTSVNKHKRLVTPSRGEKLHALQEGLIPGLESTLITHPDCVVTFLSYKQILVMKLLFYQCKKDPTLNRQCDYVFHFFTLWIKTIVHTWMWRIFLQQNKELAVRRCAVC